MRNMWIAAIAWMMFLPAPTAIAEEQTETAAPRLIKFSAVLKDASGLPRAGQVVMNFALYASQEGGEALWKESQLVNVDEEGNYSIFLGASENEGLPLELFSTGKAQWLGVQADGEEEQARVVLVAVPYALKAADADTVGGTSASSFVLNEDLVKAGGDFNAYLAILEHRGVIDKSAVKRGSSKVGGGGVVLGTYGLDLTDAAVSSSDLEVGLGNETGTNTWYGEYTDYGGSNYYNSHFGYGAGWNNLGGHNSMFGSNAGEHTTFGMANTFIGADAGHVNVLGDYNLFVGAGAGRSNTVSQNTFVGGLAGYNNTSGYGNSFFGYHSGFSGTTGYNNSFFGYNSGDSNTGVDNTFLGNSTGYLNTAGQYNTFVGNVAGYNNGEGERNVFVGHYAGFDNTGSNNTFVGNNAGGNNTSAGGNSFFGSYAGLNNTTGTRHAFFGYEAGRANATANDNTFFGYHAGYATTGSYNVFIGSSSGDSNTVGTRNNFFGYYAGQRNIEGSGNSFFGNMSGEVNTLGDNNSFFGRSAGPSNSTESNNSLFGTYSDTAAGITNATAIGYRAKVTQSNSLVLGGVNGVNGASAETNVGIGVTNPDRQLTVEGTQAIGRFRRYYGTADTFTRTYAPAFLFERARPTALSPTDIIAGDYLGKVQFRGRVGGNQLEYGAIAFIASDTSQNGRFAFVDRDLTTERMSILNTGNVGIGTTAPQERLHVIGNIKLTGDITSSAFDYDVPDYVFEPDYDLMQFDELEEFIAREKHLPNVPSAAEIRDKGLNLSEFQLKLLEKIEELTLYTMQQAKTIALKDTEIDALKSQNSSQDARIAALEEVVTRLAK